MKFEMEQRILAEMAGKAKRIASDSLPVEILRGVYLECSEDGQELSMIATDASLSIFLKGAAKVAESGRIVLNARLLFDIISHAPGEIISFCTNDAQSVVEIRSGQSVYEIPFLSAKDYPKPEMPFPEDTVRLRGIRSLAMKTAFAVHEQHKRCAGLHLSAHAERQGAGERQQRLLCHAHEAERCLRGRQGVFAAEKAVFEIRGNDTG